MSGAPWATEWSFRTADLEVRLQQVTCEDDPEDQFDDAADIDDIRMGLVSYFDSRVQVVHRPTGTVLGSAYLGGSSYRDPREFWTAHRDPDPANRNCSLRPHRSVCHYSPDMVLEACQEARAALDELTTMTLRRVVTAGEAA